MDITNQVLKTLIWKKSDVYCAAKIGISLEEYKKIKKEILHERCSDELRELKDQNTELFNQVADLEQIIIDSETDKKNKIIEISENLENKTATIRGITFTEPQSAEDIIKILKIDQTKWKLRQYWNKQHKDCWLVSALVQQNKSTNSDLLHSCLNSFTPPPIPTVLFNTPHINSKYDRSSCAVLSIQDLHFGKMGNEDVDHHFRESVINLVHKAYSSYNIDRIIYVIGGDLLNMDTFNGSTTKGTPVDNSMYAQDAYNKAFEALYWSVGYLKQFCNKLDVVYIPGNHDRLSSYHIAHALEKCFLPITDIKVHSEYSERKVLTYGKNFIAVEHGDVSSKDTPLIYAIEYPELWGKTTNRVLYMGHWHKKRTVEFVTENERNGFMMRVVPSLSATDYWHYHNKFVGSKRAALMDIYDEEKGRIAELIHYV